MRECSILKEVCVMSLLMVLGTNGIPAANSDIATSSTNRQGRAFDRDEKKASEYSTDFMNARSEKERMDIVVKMIDAGVIGWLMPIEMLQEMFRDRLRVISEDKRRGVKWEIVYFAEQPKGKDPTRGYSGVGWYLSVCVGRDDLIEGYCLSNSHKPLMLLPPTVTESDEDRVAEPRSH
jgi:hypothetical protein